jgi:restriction endonuclease S subunit
MQLERVSSGSILKSIRSSDLRKVKIILPPKEIQKLIGNELKYAVYASSCIRKNIKKADNVISELC